MKQHYNQNLFRIVALLILFFFFATSSHSAQSSTDVKADAAYKEKLRQKITGETNATPPQEEYVVGYRDILSVSVYGEGSMSATVGIQAEPPNGTTGSATAAEDFIRGRGTGIEVRLDGRISLRHIGDVFVVGMSLTQLADYLTELYTTIYSDPQLTVTLVQSNSLQYTVMGQVIAPGLFHLDYPITIVRAVARAGGFTEWANSDISVIRPNVSNSKMSDKDKGKEKTYQFDFDDFLKGKNLEHNIYLQSGDIVVVH